MSSELLGSAQNVLKGNLGGAWDITNGYQDAYTDLGIARRFGGAATAYSLRDIGAMNGRVVKVRRDVDGDGTDKEEDFSANQVQSGALEDWVNGKLESTLPADVATAAAAYSLRKVKADYSGEAVRIRRSSDDVEVDVAFDSDDKVSTSSSISVVSGSTSATTLGDFINGTDAFVHTWYDQAGSNDAVQATAANQPKIAESGALLTDGIDFDGSNDRLDITNSLPITGANARSVFTIVNKDVSSSSDNILGIGDNGSGVNSQLWNLATTYGLYYNGGNTVFGAGALNTNQLVTAIYPSSASDSGDTVLFINSVSSSITSNVDTTLATDNTVARIGAGGGSAGGNLDGSLQELIIYASDQSDNRFKIESNINNYYGLYTFQGDGFVETLYDQSGNGNDVDQTTAGSQPKIVDSGSQVKVDGIPSIKFDGTDDFLDRATYTQGDLAQPSTGFAVAKLRVFVDDNQKIFDGHTSTKRNMIQLNTAGNGQFAAYAGTVATSGEDADADQHLFESRFNGAASRLIIDGVIKSTSTQGTQSMTGINIGANHDSASNFWDGDIQEIIIYNSDLFNDRSELEDDINNYYTIY